MGCWREGRVLEVFSQTVVFLSYGGIVLRREVSNYKEMEDPV